MKYVTGIRPTGRIHLGNYLGAIKHGREIGAMFFVADLHAPAIYGDIVHTMNVLQSLGVATELESNHIAHILCIQHNISRFIGVGRLERMTQYKDKCETEQATLKLLSYPVLMAADIFYYGGTHIPVGADQLQHIEFVRDVCDILAHNGIHYAKPEAVISQYPRIMSLTDGTKKMSKSSDDGFGCIYLDDSADVIRQKIASAKTGGSMLEDTPEIRNLKTIYMAFGGTQNHMKFKDFKEELSELIIKELGAK